MKTDICSRKFRKFWKFVNVVTSLISNDTESQSELFRSIMIDFIIFEGES